MNVLVVGGGGREHAIAWKLSQSQSVQKVFCAPGNAGTAGLAENVPISPENIPALADFAVRQKIDVTVVGPDKPLAIGIADFFEDKGLKVFGPKKEAAEIESSKVFCRRLMKEASVPQPGFKVFENADEAVNFVKNKGAPVVVKADGLALGKGVIVAENEVQAVDAINKIMVEKVFGESGNRVLLEEKLSGQEASFLCFVDGKHVLPLATAQDYKRAFDGDNGPNTGGMGAYTPTPFMDFELESKVIKEIMQPAVDSLRNHGREFKGILYAGLMISEGKPRLIEFNARFGDPETQAVLPRLITDIMKPINASIHGELDRVELEWKNSAASCVVLASGGYPEKFETGKTISGLNIVKAQTNSMVFHAGTRFVNGKILTAGGRVLNVVGLGKTVAESVNAAYNAIKKIHFENMFYRKDIAASALR